MLTREYPDQPPKQYWKENTEFLTKQPTAILAKYPWLTFTNKNPLLRGNSLSIAGAQPKSFWLSAEHDCDREVFS